MTSKQEELLIELEEDLYCVFESEFISEVNTHFGTSLEPIFHSQQGELGSDVVGPKGYTGEDCEGLPGFVIAPAIAKAVGCSMADYDFRGRGRTGRAAIEAVRKKI